MSETAGGTFATLARPATPQYTATFAELGAAPLLYFRLDIE
jgi:hypothetical protein